MASYKNMTCDKIIKYLNKMNVNSLISGTSIGSSRIDIWCGFVGFLDGEPLVVDGGKSKSMSKSSFTEIIEEYNLITRINLY